MDKFGAHRRIRLFFATSVAVIASVYTASAQTVTLDVQGEITPSCALSGLSSTVSGLDFTSADSTTLDFTVDCNSPFAYALESTNQGFSIQGGPTIIGGGFATTLPYNVTSSFTTDNGTFGDTLTSTDLTAANAAPCIGATFDEAGCTTTFQNSGTDVAADPSGNNASLQVSWGNSAEPLLAGTYQDTLTLTVRAK